MNAKSLFYSKEHKFSDAEERAFAREKLIYNVTEDLLVALEDNGISKSDLARKLGKGRAFVSQLLSGKRNMTLTTLSDICFALDSEPDVRIQQKGSIGSEPEWHELKSVKIATRAQSNVIYMDNWTKQYQPASTPDSIAIGH